MNKANEKQQNILANSTYEIWGNTITLTNGHFRDEANSAIIKAVDMYDTWTSDLTGAGIECALVHLTHNTGGMGWDHEIAVMIHDEVAGIYNQVFMIQTAVSNHEMNLNIVEEQNGSKRINIHIQDPDGERWIDCSLSKLYFQNQGKK